MGLIGLDRIRWDKLVPAAQMTPDPNVDLITKEGIRLCSAHLFLDDLVFQGYAELDPKGKIDWRGASKSSIRDDAS